MKLILHCKTLDGKMGNMYLVTLDLQKTPYKAEVLEQLEKNGDKKSPNSVSSTMKLLVCKQLGGESVKDFTILSYELVH